MFFSCGKQSKEDKAQGDWIKGTKHEQIKIIEKQFRGFDNAMIEVGYRYQELYWAGQDENWEYANYQLEKIKLAIENALERRPKRAKAAKNFMNNVLPEMKKSIQSKDSIYFNKTFLTLTLNCNGCHMQEKISFFNVQLPTVRQSPIYRK
jgi:hypothetical protein